VEVALEEFLLPKIKSGFTRYSGICWKMGEDHSTWGFVFWILNYFYFVCYDQYNFHSESHIIYGTSSVWMGRSGWSFSGKF
jgi:hypothetical protein